MQLAPTAPRLLLVEDYTPLRMLFRRVLEPQGYAVHAVSALAQARPLLTNKVFQVILVELNPATDLQAFTALEAVREEADHTPILLLSRGTRRPSRPGNEGSATSWNTPFPWRC